MSNEHNGKKKFSRRAFVKDASLAAGSFIIVPRHVLGRGFIAPSDKLNIAGIGAGGKGGGDLKEFSTSPKVNIVALCDVDDRRSAESRQRFPKAKYYKDFREMLEKEKKNIDACSISTPDHVHAIATLSAMQLGKHVYTQKPLTHDIYEARLLADAAKRYKVITQMGNQGGSSDGVRQAKEMYDAGLLGEVSQVYVWTNRPVWPQALPTPTGHFDVPKELDWNLWLGPAKAIDYHPSYLPFNWRGWNAFGTGALGDMACHLMDPVFRLLPIDFPTSVECSIPTTWSDDGKQAKYPDGYPSASIIHLDYPRKDGKGNIKLTWMDGGLLPMTPDELLPGEPFGGPDGGALFIGSKSKMLVNCYGENPRLLPSSLMQQEMPKQVLPRVPEGHYIQWVNACIAGYGKATTSSPFEYAGPFTESVLIGNLAIRSWSLEDLNAKSRRDRFPGRKKLLWDAKQMRITNFDDANQFVKAERREGWSLDGFKS